MDGKLLCFPNPGVFIGSKEEGSEAFQLSSSDFIPSHSGRLRAGEFIDRHRLIILPRRNVTLLAKSASSADSGGAC